MRIPLFIATLFLSLVTSAQGWRWGIGSAGDGDAFSIAVDKHGNIYSSGVLLVASTVAYFGPDTLVSPSSAALISVSPSGTYRWVKGASGSAVSFNNVAVDTTGNVYLFGSYHVSLTIDGHTITSIPGAPYAAFYAKFTSSGALLRLSNVVDSSGYSCVGGLDDAGNIYVAGNFYATHLTIGASTFTNYGFTDNFIVKLDTAGIPLWAHTFGGSQFDAVDHISVSGDGRACIIGSYYSPAFYVGPDTFSLPTSGGAFFAVSYNTAGYFAWAKGMQYHPIGMGPSRIGSVHVDKWDNAYVDGAVEGSVVIDSADSVHSAVQNPFLVKIDTSGHVVWARASFDSTLTGATALVVDTFANIWMSGPHRVIGSIADSLYLLRLDTSGTVTDSILLAAGSDDMAAIGVDNHGGLLLACDYGIDFFVIGSDTLRISTGSMESFYFAKYCYLYCLPEHIPEQQHESSGMSLYPNPATNELIISSGTNITRVTLLDIMGQQVSDLDFRDGEREQHIDISQLPPGVYIVNASGCRPAKFVKL